MACTIEKKKSANLMLYIMVQAFGPIIEK